MKPFYAHQLFVVMLLWSNAAVGKECNNEYPWTPSHTLRHKLLTSKNQTEREMLNDFRPKSCSHGGKHLPRKISKVGDELPWAMMQREMKNLQFQKPKGSLKEVSLHDVRLEPNSFHWQAQETNLKYLLMLDVDSLVWSFRNTSGLPTPGTPYGGWEAPNSEIRGHFVGHYLSATALMWASTHSLAIRSKMDALVYALSECQKKIGSGYVSAFPAEFFDRLEALQHVWVPYYTIDKIFSGLLDQYELAGNELALEIIKWMVDYYYNRVQNVIRTFGIERHYQILNEETGAMNDNLYRLYSITGDPKHAFLAHLFDKPCFLGILAVQANDIASYHANCHIPLVLGIQRRYELIGDPLAKTMATYFMDIVNSTLSYATGGTSLSEHWTDPNRLATTLESDNEESCTTYNMLKISRNLFMWTKEMPYADHYERALINGVLGIQRGTEPGLMIYFLPLGHGVSKAVSHWGWGTLFNSFWCCYGSGIESFSKLGDSIYFEEDGKPVPELYIIQYISSTTNWKSGNMVLNQHVEPVSSSDPYLRVTFSVLKGALNSRTLNFRIPFWTNPNQAKAALNSQNFNLPAAGNFLTITRPWTAGDKLTLVLPMTLRAEAITDDRPEYASLKAMLYGPYLLAGHTYGDYNIETSSSSLSDWISPVPAAYNSQLVTFSHVHKGKTYVLTNTNGLSIDRFPEPGTNVSVNATFRLILPDSTAANFRSLDAIGKSVMLEPFAFPGKVIVVKSRGDQHILAMEQQHSSPGSSLLGRFNMFPGLSGKPGTVSFESEVQKGCYLSAGEDYSAGAQIKLKCISRAAGNGARDAVSFVMGEEMSKYHPISFIAKGDNRSYLMQPLLSLMSEYYSVYFNIQT